MFDVAVIGAGVVGCAIARRFTLDGARVVVLEKAPTFSTAPRKGNSAILHTGFDAPPGSLELACMQAGYAEYLEIRERLDLPLMRDRRAGGRLDRGAGGALPALDGAGAGQRRRRRRAADGRARPCALEPELADDAARGVPGARAST